MALVSCTYVARNFSHAIMGFQHKESSTQLYICGCMRRSLRPRCPSDNVQSILDRCGICFLIRPANHRPGVHRSSHAISRCLAFKPSMPRASPCKVDSAHADIITAVHSSTAESHASGDPIQSARGTQPVSNLTFDERSGALGTDF